MTFIDFIQTCRVTDTLRGDFIADTQSLIKSGAFPDIASWGALEAFMRSHSACPEAVKAGRRVWRRFAQQ
jgi:hypothetical protein